MPENVTDEENFKSNVLKKAALAVEIIRLQSHAKLCDLERFSNGYTTPEIHISLYETLHIAMPEQWLEILDHLSFFPPESHKDMAQMTCLLQIYVAEHDRFIARNGKNIAEVNSMNKEFRDAQSNFTVPPLPEQTELIESVQAKLASSYKNAHEIGWKRAGNLHEQINCLALKIMQLLPLSKEWIFDKAPYPPR